MNTSLAQRNGYGAAPPIPAEDLRESPAALESYTRAEIDMQIATARRFPRSIQRVYDDAVAFATLNQAIAARCTYAKPNKSGPLVGPSVRLAEIMASCYGNLRTTARITNDDGRMLTAQAVCIDLEKNNGVSIEVMRSIVDKEGRRFTPDMVITTANAAISIAFRNAVFRVVPRSLVDAVHDQAKACAAGSLETHDERRQAIVSYWIEQGVPFPRVLEALGVNGMADIGPEKLTLLQGYRTALEDGEATIAGLFPTPQAAAEAAPSSGSRSRDLLGEIQGRKNRPAGYEPGSEG